MRLMSLLVVASALITIGLSTAEAQSLRDSLTSAYNTNPDLGAARAQLRSTDELVSQALSGFRPQVGARASYDIVDLHSSIGNADLDSSVVGLQVTQPLYRGGGLEANLRASEDTVRANRASLIVTEQQVLYDGVQAYAGVWRDRSVLELAINNEKRLQRQLQATKDRFNVGEVARTDVAQAEARLSGAEAERVQAEGQLANSIATFRRVISMEPSKVDQPLKPKTLPANEAQAQELASANPNIAQAQYSLAAAKNDVDVAFAQILPQVNLRASTSYANEPSSNLDWERDASIGVEVTVPLYQGGGEYSQVRQNKQIARQRGEQLVSAQRGVSENVTIAWETLQTNTANIASRRAQVKANQIALEGTEQEAQVGARTVLDVLDAENELFSSQVELVRAQANEAVAAYALLATVGQLTAEQLDLDVERYDAEKYYKENRTRLFGLGDPLD